MNEEQAEEVRVISDRIAKTEMARALIEAEKYDAALTMLEKLKKSYDDPFKQRMIEHLIEQATSKKDSRGLLQKITRRFKRNG